MYTVEGLRKAFQEFHDNALNNPHIGSEPEPLFNEDGSFNPNNWYSNQADVRTRLYDINVISNGSDFVSDSVVEHDPADDVLSTLVMAHIYMIYDQTYIVITVVSWPDVTVQMDSYTVTWYKDRGCTERITKNGMTINILDYVSMLNILVDTGFFDPKNWH